MIYVLTDNAGHVKVGRAKAPNLIQRMRDLQTGDAHPHTVVLLVRLASQGAEVACERVFHRAFAPWAVGGGAGSEWYTPRPELWAWCHALCQQAHMAVGLGAP